MGEWLDSHGIELLIVFLLYRINETLLSLRWSAWDNILFNKDREILTRDVDIIRGKLGLGNKEWH